MTVSPASNPPGRTSWLVLAVYGLMLAAAVGLFFLLRMWGEGLPPAQGDSAAQRPPAQGSSGGAHVLLHVLVALAAVILVGRILGLALIRLGQPPVIGEVLAGILLGPSLLG